MLNNYKILRVFFALVLFLLAIGTACAQIVTYADLKSEIDGVPSAGTAVVAVPGFLTRLAADTGGIAVGDKNITLYPLNVLDEMVFDSLNTGFDAFSFFTLAGGTLNINGPVTFQNGGSAIYGYGFLNILTDGLILFDNLSAANTGSAIISYGGLNANIGTVNSTVRFTNNSSPSGGAIYIAGDNNVINIDGAVIEFSDNTSTSGGISAVGGAIYQNVATGTMTIGSADSAVSFVNNTARNGGAIYNKLSTLNIYGSTIDFTGNTIPVTQSGGAIQNERGGVMTIGSADSVVNFTNNSAGLDGGLGNLHIASIYGSIINFVGNNGGAIGNWSGNYDPEKAGVLVIGSAGSVISFTDNVGSSYGAIYNYALDSSSSLTINGSADFSGNIATASYSTGGAIDNRGTLYLNAMSGNISFTGNTANGVSSAIYNHVPAWVGDNEGILYLNALYPYEIIFNDRITGGSTININTPAGLAPTDGTIVLNEDMTGWAGTLNMAGSGWLKIAAGGTFFGAATNMTLSETAGLDTTANGIAGDVLTFTDFTVNGAPRIKADIDLANIIADQLNATGITSGTGKLDYSLLKLLSNITGEAEGSSVDVRVLSNTPSFAYLSDNDFYTYYTPGATESYKYHVTASINDTRDLTFLLAQALTDPFQDAVLQTGNRMYYFSSNTGVYADDFLYDFSSDPLSPPFDPNVAAGILNINGDDGAGGYSTVDGAGLSNIFILDDQAELYAENIILTNGASADGGGIYNEGTLTLIESIVSGNSATGDGGAVYNAADAAMFAYNTTFDGNSAAGKGGAIYNEGAATIVNSVFTNNGAYAVYNAGDLNLAADMIDFTLDGSNAVYLADYSTTKLLANMGTMTLDGGLVASGVGNNIGINASEGITGLTDYNPEGTVILDQDISSLDNTNTVNLYAGTLKVGANGALSSAAEFNMYQNAALDLLNGKTDTLSISNFNLIGSGSFVKLDVDLAAETADNFIGTTLQSGAGPLVMKELLLWSDMLDLSSIVQILIADDPSLADVLALDPGQSIVYGPLYGYNASYEISGGEGYLVFGYLNPVPVFNPAVFIPQVAAQTGGYMSQINSYAQGFEVLDNDYENECPSCGLWARGYGYREDIDFKEGPKVSNTAWGTYVGFDTKPADMGGGWENNYSFYAGYNNNTPRYDDIRIEQQGVTAGLTAAFYKEKFFGGVTLNTGTVQNKATSLHGKEEFDMFMAGVAAKAGYKIPLNGDGSLTLQPIANAAYSYISVQDYTSASGLVMTSNAIMPLTVAPELKLQADLSNRWTLYAGGSYIWNFMDDNGSFKADDMLMPQISIEPYLQYGVGISKSFGEHFKAGLEGFGRSLGREGYGGQVTLRWNFGKCQQPAPVYVPAPEPVVIEEPKLEIGKTLSITGSYFDTNSFAVTSAFEKYLESRIEELKQINYEKVEIVGHTDSTGSADYNMWLSEQRAQAIAEVFISNGIPAEKVGYWGAGQKSPIADNRTREGRAENRRVDITVR